MSKARRTKLTPKVLESIRSKRARGLHLAEIAAEEGVSVGSVHAALQLTGAVKVAKVKEAGQDASAPQPKPGKAAAFVAVDAVTDTTDAAAKVNAEDFSPEELRAILVRLVRTLEKDIDGCEDPTARTRMSRTLADLAPVIARLTPAPVQDANEAPDMVAARERARAAFQALVTIEARS